MHGIIIEIIRKLIHNNNNKFTNNNKTDSERTIAISLNFELLSIKGSNEDYTASSLLVT